MTSPKWQTHLYLPDEVHEALVKLAEAEHRSVTQMCYVLLLEALEARKK